MKVETNLKTNFFKNFGSQTLLTRNACKMKSPVVLTETYLTRLMVVERQKTVAKNCTANPKIFKW